MDNTLVEKQRESDNGTQIVRRNPKELNPHPMNSIIYQDRDDPEYEAAVLAAHAVGKLEPVTITSQDIIISGHRRWGVISQHGLPTIDTIMRDFENEELALVQHNAHRDKRPGEKYEEAKIYKVAIEGKKKSKNSSVVPPKKGPLDKHARETDTIVAAKVGLSRETYRRLCYVLESRVAPEDLKQRLRIGDETIGGAHAELLALEAASKEPEERNLDDDISDDDHQSASQDVKAGAEAITLQSLADDLNNAPDPVEQPEPRTGSRVTFGHIEDPKEKPEPKTPSAADTIRKYVFRTQKLLDDLPAFMVALATDPQASRKDAETALGMLRDAVERLEAHLNGKAKRGASIAHLSVEGEIEADLADIEDGDDADADVDHMN